MGRGTPGAVLFTQCLQNDFVRPLRPYAPLPNRLHIGYAEARRLMGEDPAESPVARVMEWAYRRPPEALLLVHIRDEHAAGDERQRAHLRQFGDHCLAGTDGAANAFAVPDAAVNEPVEIQSPSLNDFCETPLADRLAPYADAPMAAGIVGVWTEAKVFFLAYELATRYPAWRLGVCPALTAGSSRAQHYLALDQLRRVLGVRILDSVGDFLEFLGGRAVEYPLAGVQADHPAVAVEGAAGLGEGDRLLLRYLFRDCRRVEGRVLDGGFSGNLVLGTASTDLLGHAQVPHVVKIGPRTAIGQERTAFERIEEVLGNCAPRISDFADHGGRGAIKYRYASMSGASTTTFQKAYARGMPPARVEAVLREVFVEQLGRLYEAAELESVDLLAYYQFHPRWAPAVRDNASAALGAAADEDRLSFPDGAEAYNPAVFYERELDAFDPLRRDTAYVSYVHGDLNGANIILDSHENVWLIDFFHTHRGHVLRDLVKLENDLLYIFTPVESVEAFAQARRLSDLLLAVEDLAAPLPEAEAFGIVSPEVRRAYETCRILRGFYPALIRTDRGAMQWRIAALRYAVHTLSFEESRPLQRCWALYTAGRAAERIAHGLRAQGPLRIDWIADRYTGAGRVGITLLPGRRDFGRVLADDLAAVREAGVSDVLCLLPRAELETYGVPGLLERYEAAGIGLYHLPVVDQRVCTLDEMGAAVDWLRRRLEGGGRVLVHCTGGLGRSGMAVACYLVSIGLTPGEAVRTVRETRSPRAVETEAQAEFVRRFAALR